MIFLDSSFLISVEVETDQNHKAALKIRDDIIRGKYGRAFSSDYVFDETVTVTLGKTENLQKAVIVGLGSRASAEIVKVDEIVFEQAWELFKEQNKTKFSFTDCTTLAILKKTGIQNVATFDEEFRKIKEINKVS